MFGYCKCDRNELKLKDIKKYSSYYCSLCHALGKNFGLPYRFALSNDMTFILVCLDAVTNKQSLNVGRCPINPFKKTSAQINAQVLNYVAFLNYYLMLRKFQDNIQDESIFKRLLCRLLYFIAVRNGRYKRILAEYQSFVSRLDAIFDRLAELESEPASFDALTNCFGDIAKTFVDGIQNCIADDSSRRCLSVIFFNMGKWIYMADALDDYNNDRKHHKFNLLQTLRISENVPNKEQYVKKCVIILHILQKKMESACQQIKWNCSAEIIGNILFDGTEKVMKSIVARRYSSLIKTLR